MQLEGTKSALSKSACVDDITVACCVQLQTLVTYVFHD